MFKVIIMVINADSNLVDSTSINDPSYSNRGTLESTKLMSFLN